ncbi:MAG: type IV pilus biogenesis/stability protein PilW, partial [Porticoccaceae bacterium]
RAFLERYQQLAKASSRSLWLGVRLEHAFGNEDGVASQALALQKLFPYSREAVAYQAWVKGGRP